MAELTARKDSWMDYLPGNVQQNINTSPVLNALAKMLQRPTPDLTRGIDHDQYGSVSDRNWLLEAARGGPPKMNPLAADMIDKGGLIANFLAPGVKLPAMAPKPTGIRAYHGSPHDFDRFDISKIGTGEGAQAYGRGLYFAESEGVAKSYKEGLGNKSYLLDGKPLRPSSPAEYDAHQLLMRYGPNIDTAIMRGKQDIANGHPVDVAQNTPAVALLEKWKAEGRYKGDNTGRMYEVRINADPEQFLDWDKPIKEQAQPIQQAVRNALAPQVKRGEYAWRVEAGGDFVDARRTQWGANRLARKVQDSPEWANLLEAETVQSLLAKPKQEAVLGSLREAGIPGIKYLDQGSRAAGQGSRNYVVFDDALVEILRKYGLLPPIAAGTAAALNQEQPQQ